MESKDGHRPLTAKIVGSYLRHNTVGASQLPELIATVHRSLGGLGQQPLAEEALTPAVSVRQSVRRDHVVCLDCGYRGKTLRRHISSRHGLGRDEYLKRWGLGPTSAAGTVLVRKGQVRAHAQHAPTPIRAGIAGSHPDLIRGPVLRRDQPQSRCGPAAIIAANKRSQRPRACANPASSPIAFRVA